MSDPFTAEERAPVREPYDSALWTGRTPKLRRKVMTFHIIVEFEPAAEEPAK